ncbi:MAG TPA: hypothetical protein VGR12_03160, partial [Solirubrobacteraceae bacterium]|nr:hypothetical protein [Solirubrobacteraceae bacterium]
LGDAVLQQAAAPGAADTPAPAKTEGDPLLSDEPGSRHGHEAEEQGRGGPKPGMTSGDPLG